MPGSAFNIKKETLTQVFSCEFSCEHLFYRTSLVAASALKLFKNIDVLSADLEILINTKNLVLKNSSIFFFVVDKIRSSRPEVFCKKGVLRVLAQVFSYEFCEISKNTCFYRTRLVAAFESWFLLEI